MAWKLLLDDSNVQETANTSPFLENGNDLAAIDNAAANFGRQNDEIDSPNLYIHMMGTVEPPQEATSPQRVRVG